MDVTSSRQNQTTYDKRGSSRVCLQALTIDKLVGPLIFTKEPATHIQNFKSPLYPKPVMGANRPVSQPFSRAQDDH
jgi:hypothetical protein